MKPFSESGLFELNSEEEFYATGSNISIGENPGSFSSALSNKEQIKISFSVQTKTEMLPNSCSIYYFSPANKSWDLPVNALQDFKGPIEKLGLTTNVRPPPTPPGVGVGYGQFFIEDFVGFNHKGVSLVSGSQNIYRTAPYYGPFAQRVEDINIYESAFTLLASERDVQSRFMSGDYPKTINRNPDYMPQSSQTFTLPIRYPFLIEKIVMEIPVCVGNGWLYDKTTTCYCFAQGSNILENGSVIGPSATAEFFEQGGPGLTFALYGQKTYGTGSVLDLITKNFVTHGGDIVKKINYRKIFGGNARFEVSGLNESEVDTVIGLQPSTSFTGSITVKSTANISNGVDIFCEQKASNINTSTKFSNFTSPLMTEKYYTFTYSAIGGTDAFGRSSTGFAPSGGSIFGGEYTTAGTDAQTTDGKLKNPFYIENENDRMSSLIEMIAKGGFSGSGLFISALCNVFIGSIKNSPYLIYPGEKILLAVSKSRPAMSEMKINFNTASDPNCITEGRAQLLSSSYYNDLYGAKGHDVQLNTGSINITFYGSYVRAGSSYIP